MINDAISHMSFGNELCYLMRPSRTEDSNCNIHTRAKPREILNIDEAVRVSSSVDSRFTSPFFRVIALTLCITLGPLLLHPSWILHATLGSRINHNLDKILAFLGSLALAAFFFDELIKSIIKGFEGIVGILAFFVPFIEAIGQLIRAIRSFLPWCCNPPQYSETSDMSMWESVMYWMKNNDGSVGFVMASGILVLNSVFLLLGIFLALQRGGLVVSSGKKSTVINRHTYIEVSTLSLLITLIYDKLSWCNEQFQTTAFIMQKENIPVFTISLMVLCFISLIFSSVGSFLANMFLKAHTRRGARGVLQTRQEESTDAAGAILCVLTGVLSAVASLFESVFVVFISGGNTVTESILMNSWTFLETQPSNQLNVRRQPLQRAIAIFSTLYGIMVCSLLLLISAFLSGVYFEDYVKGALEIVADDISVEVLILCASFFTLISSVFCIPPTFMSLCLGYAFTVAFDYETGVYLAFCAVITGLGVGMIVCYTAGQILATIGENNDNIDGHSSSSRCKYLIENDALMHYIFLSAVRISDIVPYNEFNYFAGMNMLSSNRMLDFVISIISVSPRIFVSLRVGALLGSWSIDEASFDSAALLCTAFQWYGVVSLSAFAANRMLKKAREEIDHNSAMDALSNNTNNLQAPLLY